MEDDMIPDISKFKLYYDISEVSRCLLCHDSLCTKVCGLSSLQTGVHRKSHQDREEDHQKIKACGSLNRLRAVFLVGGWDVLRLMDRYGVLWQGEPKIWWPEGS